MNKTLKITLISIGSLIGAVLLVAIIAIWLVFTPARLTPIVRNQVPNFVNCDFDIEQAELTLFKSFPKFGVEIDNLLLVNPIDGCPSDTLAYIHECVVSVDVKKFLKENQIIIDECRLNGGYVNLFTDNVGKSNLDIFPPSAPDTIEESNNAYAIDLALLKLNNVSIDYTDLTQGLFANLKGLDISAKGKMNEDFIAGNVNVALRNIDCRISSDSLSIAVKLDDLKFEGKAEMIGDNVTADIDASSSSLWYESEGQNADLTALVFKYKGQINNFDNVRGNVELAANDLSFVMDQENLLDKADIRLIAPLDATLSTMDVKLGASQFALNNIFIDFIGNVAMPDDDIKVDLDIKTNTLIVEELIELVPASMREELLDGINVNGELRLAAKVDGTYNENSMPVVNANLIYSKGEVSMPEMLPYPLTDINTSIKADVNLNDKSDIYVDYLNAKMSNSSLALSGTIKDVMDKMYCNIRLNANADLDELQSFVPDDIVAKGNMSLDVYANVNKQQLTDMDFMQAKMNGNLQWDDMSVVYADTVNIEADNLKIDFVLPNAASEELSNSLAAIDISGANFNAQLSDMIVASLKDYNIKAQVSNILDENNPMSVYADYAFSRIDAAMDSVAFFTNNPKGSLAMFMKENSKDASYIAVYDSDSLSFMMGNTMSFVTEKMGFSVSANYDDDQEDLILQWSPHAGIKLDRAIFVMNELPTPIYIPSIDFQYDTTGIEIKNSSIVLGNSDFELQGKLTNVDEFIRKEDLLRGTLDFTSNFTDVNQIMEMFSGMGDTTQVVNEVAATDTIEKEQEPFMVPLGINITLNTNIKNAIAGETSLYNVSGGLTIKDGIMVLQEMGFTTDAATMMLTAMYKSPRKNHLYLGLDLHLLEIDIAEMINIIPELDTLVPMLSSFAGRAEFHFAAETYLNSKYEMKVSTLKGATAIHGKDLVILDNKTYKKLGRLLGFKDKEHNKIDKLSVEITAFKSEIDVYPTLITVDKYQAVVQGRHNLNMTYDYRLGLANPWIFKRLGILVKGNAEDLKFRFKFKKNLGLEEPKGDSKDVHVIEESLRLKKIIYDSLKDNI